MQNSKRIRGLIIKNIITINTDSDLILPTNEVFVVAEKI